VSGADAAYQQVSQELLGNSCWLVVKLKHSTASEFLSRGAVGDDEVVLKKHPSRPSGAVRSGGRAFIPVQC